VFGLALALLDYFITHDMPVEAFGSLLEMRDYIADIYL
jgi:hypothetical protein